MTITRKSTYSGITRSKELDITEAQLKAYNNGALLQNAFPNLSAGDREFFKSGMTDEEWNELFGGEEHDE